MLEDVNDTRAALGHTKRLTEYLDKNFISGSKCKGDQYGCITCDAIRLKLELTRFMNEVEYIYKDDLEIEQPALEAST